MILKTNRHEDNRRILVEWIADFPLRCCKLIEMKADGEVGNHYHINKIDNFYLLKGSGSYMIAHRESDIFIEHELKEGDCLRADAYEVHTFKLKAGSILLEASSTPYDKADEIPFTK